ncbi:MAG TPA: transposase [Phycisphaerae bacterium]|nr:transposase [Phycisphaerae bacterium]
MRLKGYDYSNPAPCLVTFCTADKKPVLCGKLAHAIQEHLKSAALRWGFRLWAWCIMPDHVHLVVGAPGTDRTVSDFVGAVKSLAAKANRDMGGPGGLWQTGFHDRILRPTERPEVIAAYIVGNPVRKGLIRDGERWPWAYLDPDAL